MILIQTTCKNKKEAKSIAAFLISKKLAACVQISKVSSLYMWKNKVCVEKERLLNIKTKKTNYELVEKSILLMHSYELPEIISFEINNSSQEYKNYVNMQSNNNND